MTSPWEEQRDGWSWQIGDLCLEKLPLMRSWPGAPFPVATSTDRGDGTSSSSGSHHDSPSSLPPWCETAGQQQQPPAPCMEPGDEGMAEARRGRSGAGAAADAVCIFARSLEGRSGCQGQRVGNEGGDRAKIVLGCTALAFPNFCSRACVSVGALSWRTARDVDVNVTDEKRYLSPHCVVIAINLPLKKQLIVS